MIEIEWKAKGGYTEILGVDIPLGTVFYGCVGDGWSSRLFLSAEDGNVVSLDGDHAGAFWRPDTKVTNYQPVNIKISVDAERPE